MSLADRPGNTWPSYCVLRAAIGLARGLRLESLENLPPAGKVIVAANHVSIWDGLVLAIALYRTRFAYWLGKAELFRNPAFAAVLRMHGVIPLDRSRGDLGAIRRALEVLEQGGCMALFPEGTRSRTGRPGRARAGVGLLARESGAPVVPVRLWNTERPFGREPFRVRFGRPLSYAHGPDKDGCRRFSELVLEEIFKLA